MADKGLPKTPPTGQSRAADSEGPLRPELRQKILAIGLEAARRVAELPSLDEVYLFVVNDLRALIEFDRCFLFSHIGGRSYPVAASNQPSLETKSKLFAKLEELAPLLTDLQKALLLTTPINEKDSTLQEIPETLKEKVRDYLVFS